MHATTILTQGGIGTLGGAHFNGLIDEIAIWNRALCDGTNICATNEILELYRHGVNRIKYQVRSCSDSTCTTGSPTWIGSDGTNQTYFSENNNNLIAKDGGDLTSSDSVLTTLPSMTFSSFPSLTSSVLPTNRYFQYRAILESNDTGGLCTYGGTSGLACSPELSAVSIGPTHYDSTAPTLISNQGVSFYSLSSFLETLGSGSCANGLVYNLGSSSSGPWMYWNGSAWATAGGTTATANSATVVNSNIASFGSTSSVYFKAFFQSSGSSACELNQIGLAGTD